MVPPNGVTLAAFGIDVDELVVLGGVGELVDAVLVDADTSSMCRCLAHFGLHFLQASW